MKRFALLPLVLLTMCAPVPAIELVAKNAVNLSDEEMLRLDTCKEQGGCYVVTGAMLVQLVQEKLRQALAASSCRRNTI